MARRRRKRLAAAEAATGTATPESNVDMEAATLAIDEKIEDGKADVADVEKAVS